MEALREIRKFVVEYHDSLCPGALERCERVLMNAGFRRVTRPATPNQGLLLRMARWRPRRTALGFQFNQTCDTYARVGASEADLHEVPKIVPNG